MPRIVLFSDGHPTAGDVGSGVTHLAADRIPVSVEPLAPRTIADSWIDAVDLPAHIATGATQPVTVTVGSQRDGSGEITLKATAVNVTGKPAARTGAAASGAVVARRAVTFQKGMTPVVLDLTVDAPGDYVVEAQLSAPGDPLAVNNVLAREAWADPRPKVLYVEGTPASARYLAGALEGAGFDVAVRPASAFPTTAAELEPYDVVVLSDIPRKAIPDAAMTALTDWVEKGGGGLLVAGGESVFGESGYRKTPIERLTPVTFERKDEPEVALVIVLDRSWSMAGSSMELTKTAAQAAVDVLTDEQSVGILTFNDKFDWDVTAAQRRQEPRRHPQEDRGDRPGRPHADLPGGRAGLPRAAQCQGAREARHPAVGRPLVSRRLRGAGQEDDRGAHHAVHRRRRTVRRSGAAQEPGDLGQRPLVCRRRRGAGAGDLRQGSEECRPRRGSTRRRSRRS